MKVALPLGLAFLYARLSELRLWHHLAFLAATAFVGILVLLQPDLGTAVVVFMVGVATVFFAGIGWRWIAGFSVLGVASLPLFWLFFLKAYQENASSRCLTLFKTAGFGLSHHTISDCGGIRRHLGQRFSIRHASTVGFFARTTHGLYLCGVCGRVRLGRCGAFIIFGVANYLALFVDCGKNIQCFWTAGDWRHYIGVFWFFYRKLIHGLRSVTRGGNAVAVGQLRRHRFGWRHSSVLA